jgi:hypothetical protein
VQTGQIEIALAVSLHAPSIRHVNPAKSGKIPYAIHVVPTHLFLLAFLSESIWRQRCLLSAIYKICGELSVQKYRSQEMLGPRQFVPVLQRHPQVETRCPIIAEKAAQNAIRGLLIFISQF